MLQQSRPPAQKFGRSRYDILARAPMSHAIAAAIGQSYSVWWDSLLSSDRKLSSKSSATPIEMPESATLNTHGK